MAQNEDDKIKGKIVAQNEEDKITNKITDETGQFDARFLLWRQFCSEHDVPVDTLPSQLTGKAKDDWEKLKTTNLENKK